MPNVPNVPGVPGLSSYSVDSSVLLVADAVAFIGLISPSSWGVFLNGVPVIQPANVATGFIGAALAPIQTLASLLGAPNLTPVIASTVDFEFRQDWPISDYNQEGGAFQSYNKVTLPYDVRVKLANGGSPSQRQAFINSCLAIANSLALFDILTPEITFTSCNVTHIDWRRTSRAGVTLIVVDMWFKKVNATASTQFTNTAVPGIAGQQSIGSPQPQSLNTINQPAPSVGQFS